MAAPKEFLEYIDTKADAFIQRLADAVAIPSYASPSKRNEMALDMCVYVGSVEMLAIERMCSRWLSG